MQKSCQDKPKSKYYISLGKVPFTIRRVKELHRWLFRKYSRAKLEVVERLDETERNTGGFGHTGVE
ncbi:MAG: hypothetical protein GY795_14960 [Desulfobacterales bacterium]|nr:hypothetical protein [Desulfobacterales bacterium]